VLVPEVAGCAAHELDSLRAACVSVVAGLVQTSPDGIVVVGAAAVTGEMPGTAGTLAPYGVPMRTGTGPPTLPLAHTIGSWLLDLVGWTGPRTYWGAAAGPIDPLLAAGSAIAGRHDRVALLVMGDASARRTEKAPGHLDPRAADYDAAVEAALASGPAAVRELDGELAGALLVAGWPAWQVLAAAAGSRSWRAAVRHAAAPYGVGYIVAEWSPD
jgi:hypothetical protein